MSKKNIEDYVERTLAEIAWREDMAANTVRFSVSISSSDNRRFEYITKKLGMKKSDFVRDAIDLLLREFEVRLEPDYIEYLKKIGELNQDED